MYQITTVEPSILSVSCAPEGRCPKSETMTQEPFKFLPSEIIISILSKLPPRTILICKCVCKSWHQLVESQEFVKSHLATSVPGLVTVHMYRYSRSLKFFEIEDGHDVGHHDLRYNLATSFSFPLAGRLYGSVDGLLCMHSSFFLRKADAISICNLITRDYIRIPTLPKFPSAEWPCATYGFGSCRMSGQYKLLGILLDKGSYYEGCRSIIECHVYTLGSGCGWRSLAPSALNCATPTIRQSDGAFVNGSLHWLGCDLNRCLHISFFDLETESFGSSAAAPPPLYGAPGPDKVELFAWGENLCLHDSTNGDEIVIWVMEEYGIAKSWTKKLVINRKIVGECFSYKFTPLKVFKNGDILMSIGDIQLFDFINKTKTFQQVDLFKNLCRFDFENIKGVIHTPSFRSLKSFGMENVISF